MEVGCHGIACVPVVISRVAYMWSQDGCCLGLASACDIEAVHTIVRQSGFGLGQYAIQINKPGQTL